MLHKQLLEINWKENSEEITAISGYVSEDCHTSLIRSLLRMYKVSSFL